jgi:hypothetical protein
MRTLLLVAWVSARIAGAQSPGPDLKQARDFAQQHDREHALEHLRAAAEIGFAPAVIDTVAAFASLHETPEFKAIRQRAEAMRYPCRAEHTFDWWAGTWDAAPWDQPQAKPGGVLKNTRAYEGCVFVEEFSASSGEPIGMSMSFYDIHRKTWRMVWNDSRNTSNDFEGAYYDGAMRFHGWVLDKNGKRMLASNTLENISPDTIKHTYALSPDSGKTWNAQSVGRFVRRRDP